MARSGVLDLGGAASGPPTPDALAYEFTVEPDDGPARTVRAVEGDLPDAVRDFVGWVDAHPKTRRGVEPAPSR